MYSTVLVLSLHCKKVSFTFTAPLKLRSNRFCVPSVHLRFLLYLQNHICTSLASQRVKSKRETNEKLGTNNNSKVLSKRKGQDLCNLNTSRSQPSKLEPFFFLSFSVQLLGQSLLKQVPAPFYTRRRRKLIHRKIQRRRSFSS